MLDFNKDTDWYITHHYFVRKFTGHDECLINSFVQEYTKSYPSDNDTIQGNAGLLATFIDGYNTGEMFAVGLIDQRDQSLAGVLRLNLNPSKTKSLAELKIDLLDEHLTTLVISDLLLWVIDYAFYCLHYSELYIYVDEKRSDIIEVATGLKLNNFQPQLSAKLNFMGREFQCRAYSLRETQWFNENTQEVIPLDAKETDQYIQEVVEPFFKTCISAPMHSTIIDFRYDTVMATNQSARSIGLSYGHEMFDASYQHYSRIDTAIWYFGKWYNAQTAHVIHRYARKVFRIQQYVFKTGHPASFIDSLPYDRGIKSYLITFLPIFNPQGRVVALQSIAFNYRIAGYNEYIQNLLNQKKSTAIDIPELKLSKREEEVLFLLICGITQEQIAEMLEVKRETVAAIIRNQLCIKFSLSIVNTKLLIATALTYGFPFGIPESLWRPSVIILEAKLSNWSQQYD
ncbi:MAG: LuxR C-terminal-related transcriptional regulator [Burkholderiales bacterium]|nr:LuxR C-terminal-related transcriptional regulator [Burkholderiales bacterium]